MLRVSTHSHKSYAFYEFLPPKETRRLLEKLEFYFTPKHGSWLNMVEIESSALTTECLDRRIPDAATLRAEVAAWERTRNEDESAIDWQFTAEDARIKLRQLYPTNHA
ncbi:transposase [Haloplanus aerogenes]|uniref:transposase n=1 Tax=Haloplanus aerogenes TaxID=660522 RepID=UPI001F543FD7|nr:transposase [Haloplanus aerogenes]